LCVGKINWATAEASLGGGGAGKKDKMPTLERHHSLIDEYSVEILIR